MLLSKFAPYYCLHYIIQEYCILYHGRVDILGRQNHGDGQFQKFTLAILLKSRKLRKFDAREIYMFYSITAIHREL